MYCNDREQRETGAGCPNGERPPDSYSERCGGRAKLAGRSPPRARRPLFLGRRHSQCQLTLRPKVQGSGTLLACVVDRYSATTTLTGSAVDSKILQQAQGVVVVSIRDSACRNLRHAVAEPALMKDDDTKNARSGSCRLSPAKLSELCRECTGTLSLLESPLAPTTSSSLP